MVSGLMRAGSVERQLVVPQAWKGGEGSPEQWWRWEGTAGINRPDAGDSLRATVDGGNAVVAIISTGTTFRPGIGAKLPGYDFASAANNGDGDGWDSDPTDTGACGGKIAQWSGTALQAVITGEISGSQGFKGVAPGAKVVPIRAGNDCGAFDTDIAKAITWASGGAVQGVPLNPNPADVILLAWQGDGACPSVIQSAINGAGGPAVVAGTTELALGGQARNGYPANCSGVFGVAPTDRSGNLTEYGSVDTELFGVDGFAPGGETSQSLANGIWTITNEGTGNTPGDLAFEYYAGSHMAAAQVAGAMAMLVDGAYREDGINPNRTWLEQQIEANDRPVPGSCGIACPEGLLDVKKATADVVNYFEDDTYRLIPTRTSIRFPSTTHIPMTITDIEQVEQPEVRVVVTHPHHGSLKIYLTTPDGQAVLIKDFGSDNGSGMRSWQISLADYVSTPAQVEGQWHLYIANGSAEHAGTFGLLQYDF
ncbi:S8 family serine peptidase [Catellatospora sp. NPDC049609]|uniref:S8 family serine peptidase n=1 Tax=Catellatospora sp. NPDC049609 TaxID=3155505 RepID=UPI00343221FB